jgi:hypothetical protein
VGNDKPLCEYLGSITQALAEESVSLIDFDELSRQLVVAQQAVSALSQCSKELELLRTDYVERISGMAKAVAAAENKKEESEEMLTVCMGLETASVTQLLTNYRRVSAKFRDTFPASFGLLRTTTGAVSRKRSYAEYK